MNNQEKQVLINAYNSFDIQTEYYDFEIIGKIVVIRRMLTELLSLDMSENILPGEYIDDEDGSQEHKYIQNNKLSLENEPINKEERSILNSILKFSINISGVQDSDNSCLRCARRMVAEVLGEPLNNYRLMMEKELKPLYYKDYVLYNKKL